jgi:hypothetical protein
MELLAMRLHVVAFQTDGAQWVWDRLDKVIQRLGLKTSFLPDQLINHDTQPITSYTQSITRSSQMDFRTKVD